MSKYRDPLGNTRYLRALFYETTLIGKETVLYTLKDWDHQGYPSLYRLYMEKEDQTEFEFGNAYLESYEHWVMLTKCTWFVPYVERWRKELELKLRARYLAKVIQDAENPDSKTAIQSARYIVEKAWEKKPVRTRGRPHKEKTEQELKIEQFNETEILNQGKRILS